MKFVERVPKFDAIQFTGGKKSAKEVIEWVKEYHYDAGWHPKTKDPSCAEITNERILIFSSRGPAMHLPVGWWLVNEPRSYKLERFCDEDFKTVYRPAKEDD